MVIALIITIPIIAFLSAHMTIKAYKMGLTHNYDLKHDIKPTEFNSPITEVLKSKAAEKEEKEQNNLMEEWLIDPRD